MAEQNNVFVHIFTSSNVMVGVCLAVIGVLSIDHQFRGISNIGDFLLSMDALLFLLASILAYVQLRQENPRPVAHLRTCAEILFITAMVLTIVICLLLAYEYI